MEMKKPAFLGMGVLWCAFLSVNDIKAQAPIPLDSVQEMRVKKHTLIAKFEPELSLTASEREALKLQRRAALEDRLLRIDTLDLSFRKRWKLLEELYLSPHADHWEKVIARTELSEEPEPDQ